jgi:hypothetical protein
MKFLINKYTTCITYYNSELLFKTLWMIYYELSLPLNKEFYRDSFLLFHLFSAFILREPHTITAIITTLYAQVYEMY